MMIGEDIGPVAVKHEEVAVPAEGETGARLGAQGLLYPGEPRLGVLPGVEIPVELVGAEGVVHVGEVERAVAEIRGEARDRGELQVAIVAVGLETGRKIAREGYLFGHLAAGDPERGALLVDAVAAQRRT